MSACNQSSTAVDDGTISTLLQRYDTAKLFDAHKNALIEELLQRYQYVSECLVQERAYFDRERKWAEENLSVSQQNTEHLQAILNRDPFVLVLIDGADLVFRNTFLRDGDIGGRRCAAILHKAINELVFSGIDDLPPETKVVVRVYADLEELTGICLEKGVIDQAAKVRSFARGFVQDKALFDIINVYSQGRESIIDKVEAQLSHHLYDFHCRQVILGCSDSSVYVRILQRLAHDEACHSRITLLSGTPLDQKFAQLPFETTRMSEVFRNTKIEAFGIKDHVQELDPLPASVLQSITKAPLGMPTPPASAPALSFRSDSRSEYKLSRKGSIASSLGSTHSGIPQPTTWASTAKKALSFPVTVQDERSVKEAPSTLGIRRNKKGQRLDPPPPDFKKDEVNRLKKLKLCNAYYLRRDCVYPNNRCTHDHTHKATASELESLKLVARMSACIHDSACDDAKCIYGHICPFPEAKEGSMRGKGCINGENCRFPAHMHGMDMTAVRVTKVT